ncbi:MFS transporter [Jiangella muralis]|uniref:MFS transporter n=1 Tax=Jiangella muralis TaxID=702383 RepID=UPI000A8DE465|nr:MFS transporter [Jiangella muralis]
MPTPTAPADRLTGRGWAILIVLSSAIFLEGLDVSMMGVALPSIRADLGLSTSSLQWVVSAYVLGYGGFVLLGGRASDLLGRRRMFVLWLTVFLLFSGLGGLATDGWMLIVARFVTGVAAAFLTPAGLSIITTTFTEGPQRNQALLVYAGIAAGGFSLGMVIGGLLTSIGWRWVFFAPVLLAAAILVAGVRLIPHDTPAARTGGGYDVGGTLSLTAAMLLLVYTVVMLPEVSAGRTATTAAAGVALLALFVTIERRSSTPLLRLGLLRSAPLVRANAGAMLLLAGFVGFQFIAVLYLQEYRGWSELQTGLALMILGLDAILAPTLTPVLVRRFGNGRVIVAGLMLATIGYALFLRVGADWTYAAMLPSLLLLTTAFALAYGPLTIAATDGVAAEEQGLASGVLTTSFQFGAALGLAVVTAVVVSGSGPAGADLDTFRTALLVPLAGAVIGVAITASGRSHGHPGFVA